MRNSRIFSLLAGIALPLVGIGIIVSCSAASSSTTTVAVTGVTIDDKSITEVTMGSTLQLSATVSPDDATDKRVTWSSSDTSIATVDENGLVTPVKESATAITITVTSVADSGITDSIDITKVVVADRVPSAPRITGSVSGRRSGSSKLGRTYRQRNHQWRRFPRCHHQVHRLLGSEWC